jgi:alkanesulfonate monooxygenase SsuD/methylene tetrahydromethanopterin reductase-like flavin-dependent oxidoreductase (luciferase family)
MQYPPMPRSSCDSGKFEMSPGAECATYRNPAMLVKQVTTLDTISAGRAMLGIGAAWNEDEHRGYGIDFPRVGERMDRLGCARLLCGGRPI